jgi:hypothetical protein
MTFEPTKIHIVTAKPANVPVKAPFELANGTNKPSRNNPNNGPPITPNKAKAAFKIITKNDKLQKKEFKRKLSISPVKWSPIAKRQKSIINKYNQKQHLFQNL